MAGNHLAQDIHFLLNAAKSLSGSRFEVSIVVVLATPAVIIWPRSFFAVFIVASALSLTLDYHFGFWLLTRHQYFL